MDYKVFVDFLFNRDPSVEWYFEEGFESLHLPADVATNYAARLFSNIGDYTDALSERNLCLGLNFVTNPSCSEFSFSFFDSSVPEALRVNLIGTMLEVFRQCFARKCANRLSHKENVAPLTYNNACYMWWDVLPRHGVPFQASLQSTDAEILQVLGKILESDSIPCMESAIHGLGHWHAAYPEAVSRTLGNALHSLPPVLSAYAADALAGRIQ